MDIRSCLRERSDTKEALVFTIGLVASNTSSLINHDARIAQIRTWIQSRFGSMHVFHRMGMIEAFGSEACWMKQPPPQPQHDQSRGQVQVYTSALWYGPHVEDEIACVRVLLHASEEFQDAVIQVEDVQDGDLLCIEAAEYLPKASQQSYMMGCRGYLHKGQVHFVVANNDQNVMVDMMSVVDPSMQTIACQEAQQSIQTTYGTWHDPSLCVREQDSELVELILPTFCALPLVQDFRIAGACLTGLSLNTDPMNWMPIATNRITMAKQTIRMTRGTFAELCVSSPLNNMDMEIRMRRMLSFCAIDEKSKYENVLNHPARVLGSEYHRLTMGLKLAYGLGAIYNPACWMIRNDNPGNHLWKTAMNDDRDEVYHVLQHFFHYIHNHVDCLFQTPANALMTPAPDHVRRNELSEYHWMSEIIQMTNDSRNNQLPMLFEHVLSAKQRKSHGNDETWSDQGSEFDDMNAETEEHCDDDCLGRGGMSHGSLSSSSSSFSNEFNEDDWKMVMSEAARMLGNARS